MAEPKYIGLIARVGGGATDNNHFYTLESTLDSYLENANRDSGQIQAAIWTPHNPRTESELINAIGEIE